MAHLLADVVSLACMLHTFCYCPDKAICSAMCRDIWPLPSLVFFVVVCFVFSMLLHLNSFLKRPGTKFPLEVDACLQLRPSVNTGTVQNALKCISSICSFFFFFLLEREIRATWAKSRNLIYCSTNAYFALCSAQQQQHLFILNRQI